MGKRRIYEAAKDLGIDSKELVKKLQEIGIEVKSHSSTVDEDDIKRALAKPVAKPAVGPKRPGMVVRKKADIPVEVAPPPEEESSSAQDEQGEEAYVERHESPQSEVEAPHYHAESESPAAESPSAVSQEAQATETSPPINAEPGAPGSAPPPGSGTTPPLNVRPAAPGGARVVRMIDRDKLISRIPPRRGPGFAPRPGGPGGPRPMGGPGSRPLNGPGGRPLPGGAPNRFGQRPGPGSLEPQMNGPMRFGPVKELRVVSDAYGKGKEMIDVAKEKAGKKPGVRTADDQKRTRLDKRSLMQMHERSFAQSRLKRRRGLRRTSSAPTTIMKASKRVIHMDETLTAAALAKELGVKVTDVIRKLMELGVQATINQPLDHDTVTLVAQAYEYTVSSGAFDEEDFIEEEESTEGMITRPPVVTVMGHVDHGKTSLLDAIRNENVAEGEAGGITQHIGAYQVDTPKGKITFLDTPGHEAFTAMRARGAGVTDIVVLVVAADDGPMPQTIEAIRHAQEANVPIIVAINKIDKVGAKPDQIMQALTEFKLVPEAWGGDTIYIPTSALKKTGIAELLEAISLQAEVLELKANPEHYGKGTVIEARLDKGFGPRASIIVEDGTVHVGDPIVIGEYYGKVRSIIDSHGNQLKEAGPSTPIEVTGMDGVPASGDQANCVETTDDAKQVAEHRTVDARDKDLKNRTPKVSLEELYARLKGTKGAKELRVIIKADVRGSVEAVRESMIKLSTAEVTLVVIQSGVGAVTESDVSLAAASGAMIICFNMKPDAKSRALAESEGVQIRTYNIIYNALDDVRLAMAGLLAPTTKEKVVGHAEVRQVFNAPKIGVVAGSWVGDGKVVRNGRARLTRDNKQLFDGKIAGLKRFKDDAKEVAAGFECGIVLEGFTDLKAGDQLEIYEVQEVARTLGAPLSGSANTGRTQQPQRPQPGATP
jgi:translation initiation factor IF-2